MSNLPNSNKGSKITLESRLESLTIKSIFDAKREKVIKSDDLRGREREAITEELKSSEGDDGSGRLEYERDE